MKSQNDVPIEELRAREDRATIDYFNAIRRGAENGELNRLLGLLDDIHCYRRRQEGFSVDW